MYRIEIGVLTSNRHNKMVATKVVSSTARCESPNAARTVFIALTYSDRALSLYAELPSRDAMMANEHASMRLPTSE